MPGCATFAAGLFYFEGAGVNNVKFMAGILATFLSMFQYAQTGSVFYCVLGGAAFFGAFAAKRRGGR